MKKIDTIKRLRLFGDFLMLGTFLLLLWLFISAYMSNDFKTSIHVNNYDEAHIEMIVLVFFLLPLFLFTTALSFLDWKQTWKARDKIRSQSYLIMNAPLHYQDFPEDKLICPRCKDIFEVNRIYSDGLITCPRCGLTGSYHPAEVDFTPQKNNTPNVKIIKNIRR